MVKFYNENNKNDEIEILPGVSEFLKKLSQHSVLMGLVTGNLEPKCLSFR